MSRIRAGFNQFKNAFNVHWGKGLKENGHSHYLLRFYSIECGLKSIYIHDSDKSHKMTSEDMPDNGHRLDQWVKDLKIPARNIGAAPTFKISHARISEPTRNIERVHEAWRYGVVIDPDNEIAILRWLERLHDLIEDRLKEV